MSWKEFPKDLGNKNVMDTYRSAGMGWRLLRVIIHDGADPLPATPLPCVDNT